MSLRFLFDFLEIWTRHNITRDPQFTKQHVFQGLWSNRNGLWLSLLSSWWLGSYPVFNIPFGSQRDKSFPPQLFRLLIAGAHFLTIHNVHFQLNLMSEARKAIKENRYPEFVRDFFNKRYHGNKSQYPTWAIDALNLVGINLFEGHDFP